ncbi:hypothetical protein [Helicobacter sp. 23-1045]
MAAARGTKGRARTYAQAQGDRKRSLTNKMKAIRKGTAAYKAYIKRKRSK